MLPGMNNQRQAGNLSLYPTPLPVADDDLDTTIDSQQSPDHYAIRSPYPLFCRGGEVEMPVDDMNAAAYDSC